jgi:hypothetical protein
MTTPRRVVIYVPGLRPKPPPEQHAVLLRRCLLEGIRRADAEVAAEMGEAQDWLRLVAWGRLLYPQYRDPDIDAPAIADLLSRSESVPEDIAPVLGLRWRARMLVHRVGSAWPALAHLLADSRTQLHLYDSYRYFRDEGGLGTRIRGELRMALEEAGDAEVLLMAHSFGSVIAWDTLWELGRIEQRPARISLFLTIGSPLGSRLIRRRLKGARARGPRRFPPGIHRWRNLAALGGLTALGRRFAEDFASMRRLGLVEEISDQTDLVNPFYGPDGLNVHRCYGYFVNAATGSAIAGWWRAPRSPAP